MKNRMMECSVCHSKLLSPSTKTISRAYDKRRNRASPKFHALKSLLVVGDCILIGLQPILVYMSKVDGGFKFSPISVNFWTEIAKVLFAIIMLIFQFKMMGESITANMTEIQSAEELVDALIHAGDKLVIVDFYSPSCGGCKALHPKICQLGELNPETQFLKVNYEELKPMCHKLHIHVLPFFKFYRGAQGHLCSFSCINATIKKFKDALQKHGRDQCSIGPAKVLEISELVEKWRSQYDDSVHQLTCCLPSVQGF